MVQESTCTRFSLMAHQVVTAISRACSFVSDKKHNPRDDLKLSRGSTRDSTTELDQRSCGAEDDNGPGSDDEDVLTSLGASNRAWRVYHREKRAHDYTKTRLVGSIRREAALANQMARVGGSVEGIERILMRLEDLEAAVINAKGCLLGAAVARQQTADKDVECTLDSPCQVHPDRVQEAEAAALHWKIQCQQLLPKLAASNSEKDRLTGELRMAKKTAVLMMNRQYGQLEVLNGTHHQSLPRIPRHRRIDVKKRSYSDIVMA